MKLFGGIEEPSGPNDPQIQRFKKSAEIGQEKS